MWIKTHRCLKGSTHKRHLDRTFLKEKASEMGPAMALVYQGLLLQGKVPSDLKHANFTPLFKKGDCNGASRYRPISLTSVCSKLMEHVREAHGILTDQQQGSMKKKAL